MRGVGTHHQRVAVRRAARDFLGADAAECAGTILDQHGLAERVLQMLADQPRDVVGAGPGREGHDDLDLPLREVVRRGGRGRRNGREQQDGQQAHAQRHPDPSRVCYKFIRTNMMIVQDLRPDGD